MNEKELKNFFNRSSIKRQLDYISGHIVHGKRIPLRLNVGGNSYTNGQEITIGFPKMFMDRDEKEIFSILKALTGHESEHIVSSNFKVLEEFLNKVEEYLKDKYSIPNEISKKIGIHILNSVEDGRIEKRLVNRMRGFAKHIKFLNILFWELGEIKKKGNELGDFLFCITSISVNGVRTKGFNKVYKNNKKMMQKIEEITPLIIRGINEPTAKGCANVCFQILEKIEDFIIPIIRKEIKNSKKNKGKSSIDGLNGNNEYTSSMEDNSKAPSGNSASTHIIPEDENKKGDKNKNKQGDKNKNKQGGKNSNNVGDEGEITEEGTEGTSVGGSGNSIKEEYFENEAMTDEEVEEIIRTEFEIAKENIEKESEKNLKQAMEEEKREEKIKAKKEADKNKSKLTEKDIKDVKEKTLDNDKYPVRFKEFPIECEYVSTPIDILLQGKQLNKSLKEILASKVEYNSRNRKRGILDTNNLWRIGVNEYDVFKKNKSADKKDYVFYLLIDRSASMNDYGGAGETKWQHAMKASAIMEEGLKGLAPFKVASFNGYPGKEILITHHVISDFSETEKMNKSYFESFSTLRPSGNKDGFSIRIATKELLKREEKEKILIVISDGLPSLYIKSQTALDDVKEAVKEARKQKINVFALMTGTQNNRDRNVNKYKYMYEKGIISCEPNEMAREVVKILKRELMR